MKKLFPLVLLALSSCAMKPGEVYPLDEATVKERIANAEVPLMVFGSAGTRMDVDRSEEDDGRKVTWALEYNGTDLFHYQAVITPEGADKTRVAITVERGIGEKSNKIFEKMKANADISKMYYEAMKEELDSKIEQRRFSMGPIYQQMMIATMNHSKELFADVEAQSKRDQQRFDDNAEKAYEAQGEHY